MTTTLSYDFLVKLLINSVAIVILVRFCYYKHSRHRAYATSFMLFGTGVFLITAMLHATKISMGFAFGLFAVFSMLRYRTESITIKEMTYLFLVISIALLSAVGPMLPYELAMLNGFVCLLAYISETSLLLPLLHEREIQYEKIENITPQNSALLMADLKERTGLDIKYVEIISANFLRDTARIKIQFKPPAPDQ